MLISFHTVIRPQGRGDCGFGEEEEDSVATFEEGSALSELQHTKRIDEHPHPPAAPRGVDQDVDPPLPTAPPPTYDEIVTAEQVL